jgi:uncharacterized protein (DUF58 family)
MSSNGRQVMGGGMRHAGIWLLMALWMLCFVFWRFQGGFVSGFLFYAVTALSLYEGLVWLAGGIGWTVETEVEQRTWTKGDAMIVQLRVRRRFPLPFVWLQGEPVLPRRLWGAYRPEEMFRLLWFARSINLSYRLSPLPRGRFVVPDVQLTCGDLFGLVSRRRRFPQEQEFVVYPRWRPLRGWPAGAGEQHVLRWAVERHPRKQGDDATVAGIRDWQPGDRLNQIHWKASARAAGLKTKLPESSGNSLVMLLLDLNRDSYREPESPLLERGVELALSLAHAAVTAGLSVGLCAAGREPVRMAPKADQRQLRRLAHALAIAEADGATPVSALLRQPSLTGGDGAELLIITPELGPAMAEAVRHRMQARRQTAVRVFWLTDLGDGQRDHPAQASLRQLGVPVYRVADDGWPSVLGTVPNRGGGVDGAS